MPGFQTSARPSQFNGCQGLLPQKPRDFVENDCGVGKLPSVQVLREHFSFGAFVLDEDDVRAYRKAVDSLRKVALSRTDTAALIAEIAEIAEKMERAK
jgi:predicted ATP-grasp superfamily ATP-dependent carboligase